MPRTVKLYPHNVATDLQLSLRDAFDSVDEESVALSAVFEVDEAEEKFLSYDLSDPDLMWSELVLDLQCDLPGSSLAEVLPKDSSAEKDLTMLVSVRCPATKVREAYSLTPTGLGKWRGEVRVRRATARGNIELVPILARKTSRPRDSAPGLATDRSAIVGEGQPIRVVVDHDDRAIHGDIDFKWEDFRESNVQWRKDHNSDIYHLDPSRERPTLFINTRYRKLRAALQSTKRNGPDAIVRHLGNAALAQSVWVQLFVVAAGGIDYEEGDEAAEPPREDWKRHVLRRFGACLFPERNEGDRIRAIAEQMRSHDQVGALMAKVGTAAQEIVGSFKLFEGAIRAGERGATK